MGDSRGDRLDPFLFQPGDDFIGVQAASPFQKSVWLEDKIMKVYLRAGRMISYQRQEVVYALCISNITVFQQRTGVFTNFVHWLRGEGKALGYTELQIENAITPEMISWCKKNKWVVKESPYGAANCYSIALSVEETTA